MFRYQTILKEAWAEQTIEKSRFIAQAAPVENRSEAEAFFSRVRTQHKSATHNVPAFVIGEHMELLWASDDGEPQGTSGAPIAQLMVKEGITNAAVIVTRYFGGIKLGTGGLVRAYTGSAKLALGAAGLCGVQERYFLTVKMHYTYHGKLQKTAECEGFTIEKTEYSDQVMVTLSHEANRKQELWQRVSDLTGGTQELVKESCQLIKVPL